MARLFLCLPILVLAQGCYKSANPDAARLKDAERRAAAAELEAEAAKRELALIKQGTANAQPPSYHWVYRGTGDLLKQDIGDPTHGSVPDNSRCNKNALGLGAVCPADAADDPVCHYKNANVSILLDGNGNHPGGVYECVYE